ncbi:phosphoribosyltransferase family protein [Micromonospora sp. NPDC001898]|uniref:phosphoribosyltransferase family protein n=1 Tax=Micromonospora sp. NPDC001898 TaxID=3364221 RepID=UPI0036CFB499
MPAELSERLVELFRWIDPGPESTHLVSDVSGWWRDPAVLAELGPALVAPFRAARPTVVLAPAVTGLLLGPLAATALGVGFVPAHKAGDGRLPAGATTWAQSPPDFRGRRVELGVRDRHLGPGDRVLVVDDWVATGAQLQALYEICATRGAQVLGTSAVVVDCPPALATELRVRGLLDAVRLG